MKILNKKSQKSRTQIAFLIAFVCMLALPGVSLAQPGSATGSPNPPDLTSTMITNPLGNTDTVNGLIKKILIGVIKIGIPIIALALVYSGFLFVSAVGKPDKLKEAKDAFLYTLIGAAILLGSWAIAQLISETVLQL